MGKQGDSGGDSLNALLGVGIGGLLAVLILGMGLMLLTSIRCGGEAGEEAAKQEEEEAPERPRPEKKIEGIRSELVATGFDGVTAIDFAPDGRLFFTELNSGNIFTISAAGEREFFAGLELPGDRESSLQGIAIDPEFEENHYVYVLMTLAADDEPNLGRPILMRFTDTANMGTDPTELMEFPLADPEIPVVIGGGIHFGPDGYLYIAIGDRRDPRGEQLAQDLSSPFGKILRVTRDGAPAPDNPLLDQPDADQRIYAYGLRNTSDFTFDAASGRIYAADNADCNELNVVEAAENYGWPPPPGSPCQNPVDTEPIYYFSAPGTNPGEVGSHVGPTGIEFVSGEVYPALGDGLLACEFNTRFMRRLQLAGPNKDQVTDNSVVVEDCTVALAASPDGIIYYSYGREIRRLPPQ